LAEATTDSRFTLADEAEVAAADEALNYVDTRSRAFLGVRFMMIRQVVIFGMSAIGTTFLIRQMGPAVWGGFATSYMLLIALDSLLSHSLIAGLLRKDVPAEKRLVASAARLCLISGIALGVLLALAPILIAPLYAPPHLGLLFGATGICVVLYAGRSLPLTLLERRLSYRVVAASEIADMAVFYAVAVPLVATGAGAWGLAAGTICRGIVTFSVVRLRERAPFLGRSPRQAIRVLLPFGLPLCALIGVGILDALVPLVLIGHSPVQLGFLIVASQLLGYAVVASLIVQRVAIPSFARLQAAEFDNAVQRAVILASWLTTAAMLVAGSFAPVWLAPLLGTRWHGGVEMLQLVAVGLMASGAVGIYGSALTARGMSQSVLHAQIATLFAYVALGAVLVAIVGPVGAAAGFAASRWLWAVLLGVICQRRLGLGPTKELLVPLIAALAVSGVLAVSPHHGALVAPLAAIAIAGWLALSHRQMVATVKALKAVALSREAPDTREINRRMAVRNPPPPITDT
jgi:O-antigen/teichoic acid export membrane protein